MDRLKNKSSAADGAAAGQSGIPILTRRNRAENPSRERLRSLSLWFGRDLLHRIEGLWEHLEELPGQSGRCL